MTQPRKSPEQWEKELNMFYYMIYALVIILLGYVWYINYSNMQAGEDSPFALFDPQSKTGMAIQYGAILYTLCAIPGALYWFKQQCRKLSELEDEELKYDRYFRFAMVRGGLIALAMLFSLFAYMFLGAYQPMIWLAAIAAVAFVFCKPNPRKTEEDLRKNDETY